MSLRSNISVFCNSLILIVLSGCQLANSNKSQIDKPFASITNTYWKLIELEGQQVKKGAAKKSEVHFILYDQDKRIAGFNGCNRFFGQFKLISHANGHGQLALSALSSTKMACRDLAINEKSVMRVFIKQVNYQITGDTLTIFDKNLTTLAKFKAV